VYHPSQNPADRRSDKRRERLESGPVIGRLIDIKAIEKAEAHIADAVKKGTKVATGGKRAAQGGSFFERTVLTDATSDMIIPRTKPSGRSPRSTACTPKPTQSRWPTLTLPRSRGSEGRGLDSNFYSREIGRIWGVAEGIECGIVGIEEGIISPKSPLARSPPSGA
jgi:succinate-semialdehyde dehydrogenase/glutarate-semialdehyde dehydrogenase